MVVQRRILTREVVSLAGVSVATALGESAGACGESGRDLGISLNPVGERILAILDDGL